MPETPEMVERVARAALARIRSLGVFAPWSIDGEDEHALPDDGTLQVLVNGHFDMMEVARAAILAMRMTHLPGDDPHIINAKRVWNAGIDAALASPEEGESRE